MNDSDIQFVRNKYGITTEFFISPNQLWKHKNQKLVIEAALFLQKEGKLDFQIIFTGKEFDDRNPEYPSQLKEMVVQNNLQHNIKFLGFIDRKDQLLLIKDSIAVIQPSLFEGWSTVVEDGKALNKFVLASDIPIHREQLKNNCAYFDPHKAGQLAKCLLQNRNPSPVITDYKTAVTNYAKQFISLINYGGKDN